MLAVDWLSGNAARPGRDAGGESDAEGSFETGGGGTRAERRELRATWRQLERPTGNWSFLTPPPARVHLDLPPLEDRPDRYPIPHGVHDTCCAS